MKELTYQECLEKMYGLGRFGIKLGLDTISGILKNLNHPERGIRFIHIAGTNGKGSIASYMASMLSASGFKTGLYTSPHLIKFNERFCINGRQVTDQDVIEAYQAVTQADTCERKATFFELATAMAFYLFKQNNVEWAVFETGMGGRLDATNILKPEISIISNLSVEHTDYLGETIEEIANEKGGIIKPLIPVVTGVTQPSALSILENLAEKNNAPLFLYNRDFSTRPSQKNGCFDFKGPKGEINEIRLTLAGDHQTHNAALALAACQLLFTREEVSNSDFIFSLKTMREGILETRWPGRLETILKRPRVILDGAHNQDAADNLGRYLNREITKGRLTLVLGILDDKPFESMVKSLVPAAHKIILTKAKINRSLLPSVLKNAIETMTDAELTIIDDVGDALLNAIQSSSPEDTVCVAGSLYVVGEARKKIIDSFPTEDLT